MTIQEAKDKLVRWCNEQIGYKEGQDNYNRYADVEGIRRLYGWYPQHQPWCDIFTDAAYISVFGYDLASAMTYQYTGAGSAACSVSAAYYKTNNAWFTSPELGDQIFFWSNGAINHTGIVTHIGDGAITTVEGNTSDSVCRRTYDVNAYNIAGYGRPRWELVETGEIPVTEKPVEKPVEKERITITLELVELSKGDTGKMVKLAQALLEANGCTVGWYGIDGDFGAGTDQAVRNFQIAHGLGVDGIIGKQTWKALVSV